jgi:hypothetical protein
MSLDMIMEEFLKSRMLEFFLKDIKIPIKDFPTTPIPNESREDGNDAVTSGEEV